MAQIAPFLYRDEMHRLNYRLSADGEWIEFRSDDTEEWQKWSPIQTMKQLVAQMLIRDV